MRCTHSYSYNFLSTPTSSTTTGLTVTDNTSMSCTHSYSQAALVQYIHMLYILTEPGGISTIHSGAVHAHRARWHWYNTYMCCTHLEPSGISTCTTTRHPCAVHIHTEAFQPTASLTAHNTVIMHPCAVHKHRASLRC